MNVKRMLRVLFTSMLVCALFASMCCLGSFTASAEELPAPDTSKEIESIEVYQMPDKVVYLVGEEFTAEGGIIKITYTDGSEGYISMTDDSVTIKAPAMKSVNTKNVQLKYEGEKLSFKVDVVAGMCNVTFVLGYDGAEDIVQEASKGGTAAEPETPVRDGYTFLGWYANEDYTSLYDFASEVQGDMSVYALWIEDGAEQVTVTFDYDYYGVALSSYSYPVASGSAVKEPAATPERTGYEFVKWTNEDGSDFDFTAPVTADTVIKASWNKATEGAQTWVFEAEDTDLTGKIGPSFSGTAQEESMIIYNDSISASNDRVVGYLYESGISLEFYLASDMDVSDAEITVRIAGEYTTMSYDGNDFQVIVNGEALSYPRVTIEAGGESTVTTCDDLIKISGVSLKQGENLIQLMTNNTNAVSGTTFKAHAPMVDCIKVTTEAVVIWDENYGEPASNY